MNILYFGKYKERFLPIINQIKNLAPGSKILELCFGDTYIAEFCKKEGYHWMGLDINHHFVERAKKNGFNAQAADVTSLKVFPEADICIIAGSFYHFHAEAYSILDRIFKATDVLLLSEPVSNISNIKGLAGYIGKKAANAGKGNESYRYNPTSLTDEMFRYRADLNYEVKLVERHRKDLIIKLVRNGGN